MAQAIVLIDYESVGSPGLANLPPQSRVIVFLGRHQKQPQQSVMEKLLAEGRSAEFITIAGGTFNNLDHHLAFYLGHFMAREPQADYLIVSNDKAGFEPLAAHIRDTLGISCKRIVPKKVKADKKIARAH